jgi:hypothetical protein
MSKPKPIPPGLTREHVLDALRELDAAVQQPFGEPTGYVLVHEGRQYPPKAVVGLAFRHLRGTVLPPQEFSGGEAWGQANYVLGQLGFDVQRKTLTGEEWTRQEVELIVADYFEMLRAELLARPYSKSAHRSALRPLLRGRSDGSIEFKHQNISAVLVALGHPYIGGYKPRANYQSLLYDVVEQHLDQHFELHEQAAASPLLSPDRVPVLEPAAAVESMFEQPPERLAIPAEHEKPWLSRRGRRVDYARRDAENRKLGELGERFAVDLERARLLRQGRDDLASKVEWVAKTCGDGVGFDVLSFDGSDASERWIEVKTTGLGKFFPFLVTANEVRCSADQPQRFQLYRLFDFGTSPRVYVLGGSLAEHCELDPVLYRAVF